ncbi:ABC transporter permease [Desulfitobacterium chlororespirans]|uniref:Peptide/nickel transport system permease protein n=1 Tax=Desulfitobacterium chlororespirans DSM 11544 TaxID=1121395 RepID=A0A1M7SK07_9FIRM|nr:ABC transporter permease [Desulfitobacterium chlororespirans]SHN58801.1 peptide/nickel transport system permease protein [Desulfitobacterium chlororespirans DSM 11544]
MMRRVNVLLKTGLPLLVIMICALGYLFMPNDPFHVDLSSRFLAPSAAYPLGTDHLGRCLLSRLLEGGRTTLGIVVAASVIVAVLGTGLGLLAGQIGPDKALFLESVLNAVTALPPVAYLIIFIGAWGNGFLTMIFAVTISLLLRLIKLVKTRTEIEWGKAYVMCAIAAGASKAHLLAIQIAPNVIKDVIRFICLSCADTIMVITGFSFIGLGLGDNVIDWGMMVSEARSFIILRPDLILYPIGTIFACTLSFNVLGRQIEEKGGDGRA